MEHALGIQITRKSCPISWKSVSVPHCNNTCCDEQVYGVFSIMIISFTISVIMMIHEAYVGQL